MLVCHSTPNDETTSQNLTEFCLCGWRLNMTVIDEKFPMMEFIKALYESHFESLKDEFNHIELHHIIKIFMDSRDPELNLDPEDLAVRLMYVGHYIGIWNTVDPYKELSEVDEYLRQMICSSIWPYIIVELNYIKNIYDMKNI